MTTLEPAVIAWRHPKPQGAQGRCIGHTDLAVDRRKAKRLAHRIRAQARRHGWPRCIHTSPLQRCRDVGRWLRAWGWRHVVDVRLLEVDFGRWDGLPWSAIARADVDAWCDDFAHHAPGGGEPLVEVLQRAKDWSAASGRAHALVVAHAGWMLARRWSHTHAQPPLHAGQWPQAPAYGQRWHMV
jgi:alpha-ribazole phosphatase